MSNISKEINLEKLKVGDEFHDSKIENAQALSFAIVEDHVYVITSGVGRLVLASDEGNGHGTVLEIKDFSTEEELNEFMAQDWYDYLAKKNHTGYSGHVVFKKS